MLLILTVLKAVSHARIETLARAAQATRFMRSSRT